MCIISSRAPRVDTEWLHVRVPPWVLAAASLLIGWLIGGFQAQLAERGLIRAKLGGMTVAEHSQLVTPSHLLCPVCNHTAAEAPAVVAAAAPSACPPPPVCPPPPAPPHGATTSGSTDDLWTPAMGPRYCITPEAVAATGGGGGSASSHVAHAAAAAAGHVVTETPAHAAPVSVLSPLTRPIDDRQRPFAAYNQLISGAAVNGTVLFAVVRMRGDEPWYAGFWRWARNWQARVVAGMPEPFHTKRLLIGFDEKTCQVLSSHGIQGCIVDPSDWWAGKKTSIGHWNLKYLWTQLILSMGYTALYSDVDVAFTGHAGPDALMSYLTSHRRATGDGHTLPDLQLMTDVNDCSDAGLRLTTTTTDNWMSNTLGEWYARGRPPCPLDREYAGESLCVSTGFWLALPTAGNLALFSLVANDLALQPDAEAWEHWEQRFFNIYLLSFVNSSTATTSTGGAGSRARPPVTAVTLDPRVFGNSVARECLRAQMPDLLPPPAPAAGGDASEGEDGSEEKAAPAAPAGPATPTPWPLLASHYGYKHGDNEKVPACQAEGYCPFPWDVD